MAEMNTALTAPAAREYSGAASGDVAIRVANLRKQYGSLEAVRGISFDVHKGEIFGLIGPDGAGKTSTFQILAGVMEASSGEVEVFGRAARDARSETGYLTQAFSLYPDLSVMENIRYVGDLRLVPHEDITSRAMYYLRMFGMERFTDRLAGRLSGGMKQKLALVCALVPQPKVLLLDEPATGLDPEGITWLANTLRQMRDAGRTILMSVHGESEISALATRAVRLDAGSVVADTLAGSDMHSILTFAGA